MDREMLMQLVGDVCSTIRLQQETSQQQLRLIETFMTTFSTTGDPEARVVRDEDELNAALSRWNIERDDIVIN